ncbi:MAG: murein hydrolase activator EnvC family protein [Bacteroidales bacterium]
MIIFRSIRMNGLVMSSLPAFCFRWILLAAAGCIFFGVPLMLHAQERKTKLQEEIRKIEEEINYSEKLLEETKKSKSTTINQLVIIKNQIESREKLIRSIHAEISAIDKQIEQNNRTLQTLRRDLEKMKEEYARMIYSAYKNRSSFDRLMFIFAARDFNQAYKRIKYFQQYTAYRRTQAGLIEQTQVEINEKIAALEQNRKEKIELASVLKDEQNKLSHERETQNVVYRNLTQKEKDLLKKIRENEKAAKKLQNEIEKIIAEEIRLASKKEGTTTSGLFALTPAELKLSADFEQNQGALPWPVERGIISGHFGEHQHPVLKQVKTKNNGIDILTEPGMDARAIFGGEVTRIMLIPNYNYVIMIRHGEFLSVYSNIDEVFVERGEKIETRQKLGRIHSDTKESKTELHFELWKGKTLLNPESWLAK